MVESIVGIKDEIRIYTNKKFESVRVWFGVHESSLQNLKLHSAGWHACTAGRTPHKILSD